MVLSEKLLSAIQLFNQSHSSKVFNHIPAGEDPTYWRLAKSITLTESLRHRNSGNHPWPALTQNLTWVRPAEPVESNFDVDLYDQCVEMLTTMSYADIKKQINKSMPFVESARMFAYLEVAKRHILGQVESEIKGNAIDAAESQLPDNFVLSLPDPSAQSVLELAQEIVDYEQLEEAKSEYARKANVTAVADEDFDE